MLFLATRVPADETRCSELHFPARCPNVIFMAKQADVYLYIYFIILRRSRPCTEPSSSSQTLCVSQPSSDCISVSKIHPLPSLKLLYIDPSAIHLCFLALGFKGLWRVLCAIMRTEGNKLVLVNQTNLALTRYTFVSKTQGAFSLQNDISVICCSSFCLSKYTIWFYFLYKTHFYCFFCVQTLLTPRQAMSWCEKKTEILPSIEFFSGLFQISSLWNCVLYSEQF